MSAQQEIERNRQTQRGLDSIQHPSDLGTFYLSMDFYDYRAWFNDSSSKTSDEYLRVSDPIRRIANADRTSVNNSIMRKTSFAKVKLPIPGNLTDRFVVAWEDATLGALAGAVSAGLGSMQSMINGNGVGDSVTDDVVALGKVALKSGARALLNDTTLGNVYDLATGSTINQNLAVLFRGPTLKSHVFKWRLVPSNATESRNIKKIVGILKRASHSKQVVSSSTSVLRYPSECRLMFVGGSHTGDTQEGSRDFLYPMRPCVVDSIEINHSPNGSLSLHQGTFDPTAVDITISFKETSYYTRDSFDHEFEYGSDGLNGDELMRGEVYGRTGLNAGSSDMTGVAGPPIEPISPDATWDASNDPTNPNPPLPISSFGIA